MGGHFPADYDLEMTVLTKSGQRVGQRRTAAIAAAERHLPLPDRLDVARAYARVGEHSDGRDLSEVFARLAEGLTAGTTSEPYLAMRAKVEMGTSGDFPHEGQHVRVDATHVDRVKVGNVIPLHCGLCGLKRSVRVDKLEAAARDALARQSGAFYLMKDGRLLPGV